MRQDQRQNNQLRPIKVTKNFTAYAAGSVLIEWGNTKVICTATIEEGVPRFLKDSGTGWLTAEYAMLPSATHTRNQREVSKGKVSGRTSEIQRIIGRSLRAAVDFNILGEYTILIDADVIQADGGTRTASVTGGMIALHDAVESLLKSGKLRKNPLKDWICAVSVGKVAGELMLDLCYEEDSSAELDLNIVCNHSGKLIEIQGTAERESISRDELNGLLDLAEKGTKEILSLVRP